MTLKVYRCSAGHITLVDGPNMPAEKCGACGVGPTGAWTSAAWTYVGETSITLRTGG